MDLGPAEIKKYSKPQDTLEVLRKAVPNVKAYEITVGRGENKHKEYNLPVAFDIETTSWTSMKDGEVGKYACMYVWMLNINGYNIVGREWHEFISTYNTIVNYFNTAEGNILTIWVQFLGYEFQFLRRHLKWQEVFASKERTPIKATTTENVVFRDSYILSMKSLEAMGKELPKYFHKKVGDLDYSKLRHSKTPLTEKEIGYCVFDVVCLSAWIQQKINQEGNIAKIPLTNTGYVRRYVKAQCYKKGAYRSFSKRMKGLSINCVEEYQMLKRAFQGGFTHASEWKSNKTLFNVTSYDFTSSYPAVMCSEKFPMSKGVKVQIRNTNQLNYYLQNYCCIFDIKLTNLRERLDFEHPISVSRCFDKEGVQEDNGRIIRAEMIATTITNVDLDIYDKFYKWDDMQIGDFYVYRKDYLPKEFILAILDLYEDKTKLKGVKGKEQEYALKKGMLNSCYGMSVTDIVRISYKYADNEWFEELPDYSEEIEKYNDTFQRFLFYPWGVFVTAYARRNLFEGIYSCGYDYIYSDTDSIKILNGENHRAFIDEYNKTITQKLRDMCEHYKIDFDKTHPWTIPDEKHPNGVEKPLGVWDFDGFYTVFRTCGAKRYIYVNGKTKELGLTVAGLGKSEGCKYLENKYGKYGVFQHFTDNLEVEESSTGCLTHTYIDEEIHGEFVDYLGNRGQYHELSYINLLPAPFTMRLGKEYKKLIDHIFNGYMKPGKLY